MILLPFALDFTRVARLIRRIDSAAIGEDDLQSLAEMLRAQGRAMPYHYLEEIWTRSKLRLKVEERATAYKLLDELNRSSLWLLQRIHMENP